MKNSSRIAAGVAGAVGGYVATFVLFSVLDLGNRADPITSGLLALFVYSPIGAIAGVVLASWLVTRSGTDAGNSGLARNSLKSLGPALRGRRRHLPGRRVHDGHALAQPKRRHSSARLRGSPSGRRNRAEITARYHHRIADGPQHHAGRLNAAGFHSDGDQPVIAGEVELAFRTSHRQLAVNFQGQPSRIYPIGLTASAPHTPEFGTWRRLADGSEIRYRAKWPGKT